MHDLDLIFMDEFVQESGSLVVPDPDSAILTASCDQAEVVAVRATYNVLLVAVGLASFDEIRSRLVVHELVHVYLDSAIPAASDDGVVITTVADERDTSVQWVMLLQL